jgi:hypothetical protein
METRIALDGGLTLTKLTKPTAMVLGVQAVRRCA